MSDEDSPAGGENEAPVPPADVLLDRAGFDSEETVLTRRQAEVLALRERGLAQSTIADRLGTSRANVSSVESSARRNVSRAETTIAVAEAITAPVRVEVEAGEDLYDVPDRVYDACDDAGIKVELSTPELIATVADQVPAAMEGRQFVEPVTVAVTNDGDVRVRPR